MRVLTEVGRGEAGMIEAKYNTSKKQGLPKEPCAR